MDKLIPNSNGNPWLVFPQAPDQIWNIKETLPKNEELINGLSISRKDFRQCLPSWKGKVEGILEIGKSLQG
jgi:hypothetical protein